MYKEPLIFKSIRCDYSFFCEEEPKVDALAYRLEDIRTPQFGNHWFIGNEIYSQYY